MIKITFGGIETDGSKDITLDRTYNSSPTRSAPSQFKVGTDNTNDAKLTDTDLGNSIPITGTESVDDCEVTTGWTDSADMTVSLNSTTFKEGTKSINLTKDGTSSTVASTSKTTTSLDFTSKEVSIWLFIKDSAALAKLATTDSFILQSGSDLSNYYEWKLDNSELTAGQWNLIHKLTPSNADSTVGTPVLGSMDFTLVKLTSTGTGITWSDGDFMMDDIKFVSSDDYFKAFESGSPIIDYTKHQVEMEGRLAPSEAVNYSIGEFGIYNSDGTPVLKSRDTLTRISKSSSDELRFIGKTTVISKE